MKLVRCNVLPTPLTVNTYNKLDQYFLNFTTKNNVCAECRRVRLAPRRSDAERLIKTCDLSISHTSNILLYVLLIQVVDLPLKVFSRQSHQQVQQIEVSDINLYHSKNIMYPTSDNVNRQAAHNNPNPKRVGDVMEQFSVNYACGPDRPASFL